MNRTFVVRTIIAVLSVALVAGLTVWAFRCSGPPDDDGSPISPLPLPSELGALFERAVVTPTPWVYAVSWDDYLQLDYGEEDPPEWRLILCEQIRQGGEVLDEQVKDTGVRPLLVVDPEEDVSEVLVGEWARFEGSSFELGDVQGMVELWARLCWENSTTGEVLVLEWPDCLAVDEEGFCLQSSVDTIDWCPLDPPTPTPWSLQPTYTPQPTLVPYPTLTPTLTPEPTCPPTSTPVVEPSPTPLPTNTPLPTLTPYL